MKFGLPSSCFFQQLHIHAHSNSCSLAFSECLLKMWCVSLPMFTVAARQKIKRMRDFPLKRLVAKIPNTHRTYYMERLNFTNSTNTNMQSFKPSALYAKQIQTNISIQVAQLIIMSHNAILSLKMSIILMIFAAYDENSSFFLWTSIISSEQNKLREYKSENKQSNARD